MFKFLSNLFIASPKRRCSRGHVLIKHLYGGYTRGYNILCSQVNGDHGAWCPICREVTFDEPNQQKWLEQQPLWIVPDDEVPGVRPSDLPSSYRRGDYAKGIYVPVDRNKPPIGLKPAYLTEDQDNKSRLTEIAEAIFRYAEVSKPIPTVWASELRERVHENNPPLT